MALHSGAAEHRGNDFSGQVLNRTARLLDTAHGGQVILSLVTAELVRDDLPAGTDLIDVGEHRLADRHRPGSCARPGADRRARHLVVPDLRRPDPSHPASSWLPRT